MFFDNYSDELQRTLGAIDRSDIEKLEACLEEARENGRRVFVLGNGGSAAAASHWVCDFGKGINIGDSKRLKIFAPSDHSSIFTAYGNDNAYDQTMVEQLKNFLEEGDLVISLSACGIWMYAAKSSAGLQKNAACVWNRLPASGSTFPALWSAGKGFCFGRFTRAGARYP